MNAYEILLAEVRAGHIALYPEGCPGLCEACRERLESYPLDGAWHFFYREAKDGRL